jgi:hypothetical protein
MPVHLSVNIVGIDNVGSPKMNRTSLKVKSGLTKRALDAGDSAAFSSIFLASSFFCSQAESTPPQRQYRLLQLSRVQKINDFLSTR